MWETLKSSWKSVDLRKKILFTFLVILIFRIGCHIPVPFINVNMLSKAMESNSGFMGYLSVFTGGAMQYGALFAMSVTPYINSSIIMQLLSSAIKPLMELQKQGEEGRKKIATITRYVTVVLGLIQGTAYYFYLSRSNFLNLNNAIHPINGVFAQVFGAIVIVLCFTAGSALMMWLGEQIDKFGVGNGISVLLFAGIISRIPAGIKALTTAAQAGQGFDVFMILVVFLAVIVFIIWVTGAERRISVQYAKRVVGRKMYGGQNSYLPIKVNMSGVMPIIFAISILMIPSMILGFMQPNVSAGATAAQIAAANKTVNSFFYRALSIFSYKSTMYVVLLFLFIIGFAYFYVSLQYNPVEMANNLRKNSGAVPGIRPGKPTSDFIKRIMSKITLLGALFLGVVAVAPIAVGSAGNISVSLGSTSLLIIIGVALDTVTKLESQIYMRHYKGFLD